MRSHLVVDATGCIVGGGAQPVPDATTIQEARRRALREGIAAAAVVGEPSRVTVFNVNVRHSGLVFGRLPSDLAAWVAAVDSVELARGTAPLDSLATGLARQVNRQPFSSAFTMSTGREVTNPVRVYVDGSYREELPSTAIGYAIVDAAGQLVALCADQLAEPRSALEAEYRALVRALRHARRLPTVTNVHVITDNMNVQKTVADNEVADVPSPPRVWAAAQRLNLLRRGFASFRIEHRARSKNRLADALAWCGHTQTLTSRGPLRTADGR